MSSKKVKHGHQTSFFIWVVDSFFVICAQEYLGKSRRDAEGAAEDGPSRDRSRHFYHFLRRQMRFLENLETLKGITSSTQIKNGDEDQERLQLLQHKKRADGDLPEINGGRGLVSIMIISKLLKSCMIFK